MTDELPYIDEHSHPIDAPPDAVWAALVKVLRQQMRGSARFARMLGCDPAEGTPDFTGRPADAIPGFRVVDSDPGHRLALRGHHRFSNTR